MNEMKINRLIFGILAAVAAFTIGITAYAAVGFGLSLLPKLNAKTEDVERILVPEPATVAAEPVVETSEAEYETTTNEAVEDFNRTGDYYLYMDDEKMPEAFSDIENLAIETHQYNQNGREDGPYWTPIVPKGSIQTKKTFTFDRIAIGIEQISFQTNTVDGVSYKFMGRFPSTNYNSDSHSGLPDITGRLIKIKDNKWAAEIQAKFSVGGC